MPKHFLPVTWSECPVALYRTMCVSVALLKSRAYSQNISDPMMYRRKKGKAKYEDIFTEVRKQKRVINKDLIQIRKTPQLGSVAKEYKFIYIYNKL